MTTSIDILARHASMKSVPVAHRQWVLRAMQDLDNHHRESERVAALENERLRKRCTQLEQEISSLNRSLSQERKLQFGARGDAMQERAAAELLQEENASLFSHNCALQKEIAALRESYAQARFTLDGTSAELHCFWEENQHLRAQLSEAGVQQSQLEDAIRKAEQIAMEAHAEKTALQRNILRERDYQLSEEAGVHKMAVGKPCLGPTKAASSSLIQQRSAAKVATRLPAACAVRTALDVVRSDVLMMRFRALSLSSRLASSMAECKGCMSNCLAVQYFSIIYALRSLALGWVLNEHTTQSCDYIVPCAHR
eukprot:6214691-Pleurochrysis_carterae.AAC.1